MNRQKYTTWLLGTLVWGICVFLSCNPDSGNIGGYNEGLNADQSRGKLEVTKELNAFASVRIDSEVEFESVLSFLEVEPRFVWAYPGDTVGLWATVLNQYNQSFSEVGIEWAVLSEEVGIVNPQGELIIGNNGGYFEDAIRATAVQEVNGETIQFESYVDVLVEQRGEVLQFVDVSIVPSAIVGYPGQLLTLLAYGMDPTGAVIPDTLIEWTVLDSSVGVLVDETTIKIRASAGVYPEALEVRSYYKGVNITRTFGIEIVDPFQGGDSINVRIMPDVIRLNPNQEFSFEVVAWDVDGNSVESLGVLWESMDAAGTIDESGKFIAGDAPGLYGDSVEVSITVKDGDVTVEKSAFASVVIEPDVKQILTQIAISPNDVVLPSDSNTWFRVYAFDEDGKLIPGVSVTWEVQDPDVGSITSLGRFLSGDRPGSHPGLIRATVNHAGKELSTSVGLYITGPLAKTKIWPQNIQLAPGDEVLFQAQGQDIHGFHIASILVDFHLEDSSIGTITPYGYFVAGESIGMYEDVVRARLVEVQR